MGLAMWYASQKQRTVTTNNKPRRKGIPVLNSAPVKLRPRECSWITSVYGRPDMETNLYAAMRSNSGRDLVTSCSLPVWPANRRASLEIARERTSLLNSSSRKTSILWPPARLSAKRLNSPGPPDSYACAASAATRDATDVYMLDESVGLKSITRRPTNRMLMMTKAVTQNQEKIFKKRRCTGTRSRKRNTLDLEFINAFFSQYLHQAARLQADPQAGRYLSVEPQRVIAIPWAMHRDIQCRERCESSRFRLSARQACGVGWLCENRCCDRKEKSFGQEHAQRVSLARALARGLRKTCATNQILPKSGSKARRPW